MQRRDFKNCNAYLEKAFALPNIRALASRGAVIAYFAHMVGKAPKERSI